MVRHIVLWKLADAAGGRTKKENMALMKEKLEGLAGQVEGLLSADVTENFTPGGYDLCLVSTHTDRAALECYQNHPAHLKVKEFVHTVITERASHDTELG